MVAIISAMPSRTKGRATDSYQDVCDSIERLVEDAAKCTAAK
jgi:hypothetical protein